MRVCIPDNNLEERRYSVEMLLQTFLGLRFTLESAPIDHWRIELDNGKHLQFEDHFFNRFPEPLSYLNAAAVPKGVSRITNAFTPEPGMSLIYGSEYLELGDDLIRCGADIFASAFFMLSRFEEYLHRTRDQHNRFRADDSLACREQFLERPVVNEYTMMLWNMLEHLGCEQLKKQRRFEPVLTHDIDHFRKYRTWRSGLGDTLRALVHKRDVIESLQSLWEKVTVHFGFRRDPYDSFEQLMKTAERLGVRCHFFFMAEGETPYDNFYRSDDPKVVETVNQITRRGHLVGIHPTYNAYNDAQRFAKEKEELEQRFAQKICIGREHYLRFEVPTTWQIWDELGMEWDSTMGFAEAPGFRCGVCYAYEPFNILTRKKLRLKERPLLVMDETFKHYLSDLSLEEVEMRIRRLMERVNTYEGEFVILWHNSSFNTPGWKRYSGLYEKVLGL